MRAIHAFARGTLLIAAAAAGAEEPRAPVAAELYGRVVESVAYAADGEVDAKEVAALIAIEPGRPLTDADTAATIRNLFKTLRYADVVITGEPMAGGGVAVTVHLWKAYRVAKLRFEGRTKLSREELRRAVALSEGEPFSASSLEAGAAALERRLSTEGYLHPSVEPEAEFDPREFRVEIVYRITAGERARVAEPYFDGDTRPYSGDLLLEKGKVRVGRRYSETKARSAADRMRRFLLSSGYFRANVELIAAEPTEDGRLRPVFRVSVGPYYALAVSGIKEKTARKEILSLLEDQGFDEGLLEIWASDRKDALQRSGHYRAKVSAALSAEGDTITLSVEEGPKYAVESIAILGNASVPEKTLRELLATRKKGLPLVQKGRLLDRDLEDDVGAILGYYRTRGWVDAKVEKPDVREGSRPGLLDVSLTIVEGPRTFVEKRTVEGASHLSAADVDRLVSVRVGEPFNPSQVRQDVAALTDYYWNNGWREATVQDAYTLSEDRTRAVITYRVEEGMRSFFGKTIVRGSTYTDPDRIERQVAWKEGEPFSEEKIADTQQNLARTGVFRTIEVRPQPADPQSQSRAVDVSLTEARRVSLLYGFGYQNTTGGGATENRNDVFGVAGITYRNLFGLMQAASLEVQYAPISRRGHVFASFVEPYLLGTSVPLNLVAFVSREPIQDIDIDRIGGYLESVRIWKKYLRVGLRYEYQQSGPTNPEDLSTIELEKFPRSDRPIKQSAIGPSFLWDRRDDILDPHNGYYASLAGKYAFPFLSADARYGKVSGQVAWFHTYLGGVFGASLRAGAIYPYDVDPVNPVPVPIPERFFTGGSTTARGFDTDLAGIPGVTVDYNTQATLRTGPGTGSCAPTYPNLSAYDCSEGPRIIGGNGFMAWSLEYRRPILGNLGVSLFYDLAQVWESPGDINFKVEGPLEIDGKPNLRLGLRQSIGAGLHYMTPIGPLRLEYAVPLERRTINFDVTIDKFPDGTPCVATSAEPDLCVRGSGSTKESGRVLLSIGYPF